MPIWTFDLPDDVQPNLVLDLSTLSVVTAPGVSSTITVEADEILEPLLDVTADGAKVSIRQIALVGRERFAGIWPWGPQTSRVRVTVPHGTRLDARLDAGSISGEHSWEQVQIRCVSAPPPAPCWPTRRPARSRSLRRMKDPWICPVRWEPCRWGCLRELRSWQTAIPTSAESRSTFPVRTTPSCSRGASS